MYICIIPHINERSRESLPNVGIVLRIDVSDQPETLQRIKKQLWLCTRSTWCEHFRLIGQFQGPKVLLAKLPDSDVKKKLASLYGARPFPNAFI